jgi:hypothetical protein
LVCGELNVTDGVWFLCSAQLAAKKNGRSDRKRNSEKANIEYRIMNIECRSKVFCLF